MKYSIAIVAINPRRYQCPTLNAPNATMSGKARRARLSVTGAADGPGGYWKKKLRWREWRKILRRTGLKIVKVTPRGALASEAWGVLFV